MSCVQNFHLVVPEKNTFNCVICIIFHKKNPLPYLVFIFFWPCRCYVEKLYSAHPDTKHRFFVARLLTYLLAGIRELCSARFVCNVMLLLAANIFSLISSLSNSSLNGSKWDAFHHGIHSAVFDIYTHILVSTLAYLSTTFTL